MVNVFCVPFFVFYLKMKIYVDVQRLFMRLQMQSLTIEFCPYVKYIGRIEYVRKCKKTYATRNDLKIKM